MPLIRHTQLPQLTPEEMARLERQRQRMGEAFAAREELEALLIEVARQYMRQRYRGQQTALWADYELLRIRLSTRTETINIAVYPGWKPDWNKKPEPEQTAEQPQTEQGQEESRVRPSNK